MEEPELLLIPGPVPVPKDVLETMGRQMFSHRGPRYAKLINEVNEGIGWVLGTKGEVHTVTGSGTAGLEFALGNCIHPDDSVLCLSNGFFGERLVEISKIFGKNVKVLEKPYGKPILAEEVERELKSKKFDVVTCVFNESSTALRNPVHEIAKAVRNAGALFIVDNISGLGMEYEMDKWEVDVTITATQKALGIPPGLSFVAFSKKAAEKADKAPLRSFYFDYNAYKEYLKKGQPPYTPCISVMVATGYMLSKMRKAGLAEFNAMHSRRAKAVRSATEALGLKLFAEKDYRSDTLTAIEHPKSEEIRAQLLKRHNIMLGGGQKTLAGRIFRIGNMGEVRRGDFERVFSALAEFLGSDAKAKAEALKAFESL